MTPPLGFGKKQDKSPKLSGNGQETDSSTVTPSHESGAILSKEIYRTNDVIESPAILAFKDRVFDLLIKHIDLNAASRMARSELRRDIEKYIFDYTEEMRIQVNHKELQHIVDDIINDMVGLGPIEKLINDPTINDIMINSAKQVYVERQGLLQLTDVFFRNEKHVLQIAQRIANQVGRRIDESSPMVDARLQNGSRVNIIIPPLALSGTSISIRKFSKKSIHMSDMVKANNISQEMYQFLKLASLSRLNIIVSGGTGAGKTTLLNALSALIDPSERIVTIEDAAELKLQQPHVVRLESRPSNTEGQGMVSIRDLVRNSLRMRPDRIIIGECRGAEAFDMIQAMNTGHDGSMSTLHANNANEAINRLENLILMSGHDLPNEAIRTYINDAIDIVIQISRMRDGIRRVTQICEITDIKDGKIIVKDIFYFKHVHSSRTTITGSFEFNEISNRLQDKFINNGLEDELAHLLKRDA